MKTLKLRPFLKDTIWGGQRLKELYDGREMDNIAEAWLFSCHEKGPSRVVGGEFDGKTMREVLAGAGTDVLGTGCPAGDFPILIKFIDAEDDLSIQVHPDNEYARINENELGKTECWYILDAAPGAELLFGMAKELTGEQFMKTVEEKTILDSVRHVKVKKGDFAFIPAGTLHAIGKGILLAEVQQSSDTTYRIFDYDRLQPDGTLRPLDVKKAADVLDLRPSHALLRPKGEENVFDGYTKTLLTECEYFTLYRVSVTAAYADAADGASFVSLVFTDGEGVYADADGEIPVKKGDSLFVPAGKGAFTVSGRVEFLRTNI